MFGRSVRVPLKLEGVIDMDIEVKNTDVILNTDCVAFIPPQLEIWRFVFTYKKKPVLEYGRGIKRGMKIHYGNALLFLLAMWWGGRKIRKAMKKGASPAELTCGTINKNTTEKKEGTEDQ
jgi:hypothetical protein